MFLQATSALDAVSELRVNEAIERILQSQETSTLIVAHRYVQRRLKQATLIDIQVINYLKSG